MKLIIDIPKEDYLKAKRINWANIRPEYVDDYEYQIAHGTPLDEVKAKIKAMFPPSGDWMYGEECEHEHTVCEVLSDVLQILDNIGNEKSPRT